MNNLKIYNMLILYLIIFLNEDSLPNPVSYDPKHDMSLSFFRCQAAVHAGGDVAIDHF